MNLVYLKLFSFEHNFIVIQFIAPLFCDLCKEHSIFDAYKICQINTLNIKIEYNELHNKNLY